MGDVWRMARTINFEAHLMALVGFTDWRLMVGNVNEYRRDKTQRMDGTSRSKTAAIGDWWGQRLMHTTKMLEYQNFLIFIAMDRFSLHLFIINNKVIAPSSITTHQLGIQLYSARSNQSPCMTDHSFSGANKHITFCWFINNFRGLHLIFTQVYSIL